MTKISHNFTRTAGAYHRMDASGQWWCLNSQYGYVRVASDNRALCQILARISPSNPLGYQG
jgi:hypothetical protein